MEIETSRPSKVVSEYHSVKCALRMACSGGAIAIAAGLMVAGPSSVAQAAKWQVTPKLEVRETYTDNVFLSATDAEEDFITTAAPGVTISREGRRFQINADYTLNYLWFANTEEDDIRHNLAASFESEAIRDLFFIEGAASVNQQFLDRSSPTSYSSANLNENRATLQAYRLSPYMRGRMGQAVEWEVRYRFNYLVSDQGTLDNTSSLTLSDGQGHEASARVGSGPGFGDLSWTLSGLMSRFKRESDAPDFNNDIAKLDLGYRVSRKFSVVGSVGYQKTNLQTLSSDREGVTWDAGFSYAPGPRTFMTVRYGRRINDKVMSGSFSYRVTSTSTFNLSYSDSYQTSQQFISSLLDGIPSSADEGGVAPDLSAPGFTIDDRAFRSQRGVASWAFNKNKTSINFSGYYELRDYDQSVAGEDKSLGASLNLSRKLSRKNSVSLAGQYRKEDFTNASRVDHNYTVSGRYEHRLSERLSAYIQVFHYQRLTNSGAGEDLQENGATIAVKATF